jgi:hypothetical protein
MTKLEKLRNLASKAHQLELYDDGNKHDPDFNDGWDACQATLMPEIQKLVEALEACRDTKYFNPVADEWQPSVVRNTCSDALRTWEQFVSEELK